MKKLLLALLLAGSTQLIQADNVAKNSDFADGAVDWHGDGRTPSDMKPQDSLDTTAVDYGDKGLIIPLKPRNWTKIVQEFKTNSSSVTLSVTYKLAPNTVLSQKEDDYANVPDKIGFDAWAPFKGKPGEWMTMISDFTKSRIFFSSIAPKGEGEQTFHDTVDSLVPEDEKTLCLAFPPGTGAIILLHVSLDTK